MVDLTASLLPALAVRQRTGDSVVAALPSIGRDRTRVLEVASLTLKELLDLRIFQALAGYGGRSSGEGAAACSAVKATASRCRDLRFAAALTASARCRNGRHDRHLFARELPFRAFLAIAQVGLGHQPACRRANQPPPSTLALEVGACGRRGTKLPRTEVSIMAAEHAAARSPPDRPSCPAAPRQGWWFAPAHPSTNRSHADR